MILAVRFSAPYHYHSTHCNRQKEMPFLICYTAIDHVVVQGGCRPLKRMSVCQWIRMIFLILLWPCSFLKHCFYVCNNSFIETSFIFCLTNNVIVIIVTAAAADDAMKCRCDADESTRVFLQPIRGIDGSDYINASFIDVSSITVLFSLSVVC